jgi:hypothetical protein
MPVPHAHASFLCFVPMRHAHASNVFAAYVFAACLRNKKKYEAKRNKKMSSKMKQTE